jgi:hypothetical protein
MHFHAPKLVRAIILGALALSAAPPASAQYSSSHRPSWYGWPGGFIAGGRGGTNADLFQPRYAVAAGYQLMTGDRGVQLGVRAVLGYASFRGDADAYREALHLASATTVDGGGAGVIEEGGDLLVSDRSGPLVLHGFYGLRLFHQSRGETRVQQGAGTDTLRYRYRRDFGRSYGFGTTLQMSTGGGVFAEWFRTQPYDRSMIRQAGVRLGLSWTH